MWDNWDDEVISAYHRPYSGDLWNIGGTDRVHDIGFWEYNPIIWYEWNALGDSSAFEYIFEPRYPIKKSWDFWTHLGHIADRYLRWYSNIKVDYRTVAPGDGGGVSDEAAITAPFVLYNQKEDMVTLSNNDEKHGEITFFINPSIQEDTSSGFGNNVICLLYTSPSPRDVEESRMPSSA